MRAFLALVVIALCAGAAVAVSAQGTGQVPDLTAAKQAYRANVKLGESLAGKPASAEQVAEAQRLFDEALMKARGAISESPQSADAHRLVGLVLCTAYKPVTINPGSQAQGGEKVKPPTTVLLRGAAGDCQEGVAELRSALQLANSAPDYVLDYAEAMFTCGDAKGAQEQAASVWDQRASLSKEQSIRCARLLAECGRATNTPDVETRWLQEVLKLSPKDKAAGERLTRIAAAARSSGPVTWRTYETGTALARQADKPVLIEFEATWCGVCKMLERDVIPSPEFISFARKLLCIKVDGDARPDLKQKHRVTGFPTAVVLDPSGRELYRLVGYRPAKDYVAELQKALPPS
jgi:thioredoxin-like negative regulator of GroEL